ncbi:MAG: helix-turn-helix domain-containing protein [Immundisolibacterales bacterium]|nr:helix-turn-helix domain-containing protein [Immundisolibacterales bacterium]
MEHELSLIGVGEVCRRLDISRPSLYRLLKAGRFPAPTYPGGMKSPRWSTDEVAAWIEGESAKRAA